MSTPQCLPIDFLANPIESHNYGFVFEALDSVVDRCVDSCTDFPKTRCMSKYEKATPPTPRMLTKPKLWAVFFPQTKQIS
jgi:hypothetical protein